MNEKSHNSLISEKNSDEVSQRKAAAATDSFPRQDDDQIPTRSTEDDIGLQCPTTKTFTNCGVDREPMFVIVDSSCVSNPSSKELLIDNDNITNPREAWIKYINKNVLPIDVPSTSKDHRHEILAPQFKESESRDELQMIDINLQSENDITIRDNDIENESIVISYLRNKDAFSDLEGAILSTKKKASLLDSVPKMETILEGEQFTAFSINITELSPDSKPDMGNKTTLQN